MDGAILCTKRSGAGVYTVKAADGISLTNTDLPTEVLLTLSQCRTSSERARTPVIGNRVSGNRRRTRRSDWQQ